MFDLALLESPEFWKSIAFLLSVGCVLLPLYRLFVAFVKKRSRQMASQWEEALTLRREAEKTLKDAQRKDFHKEHDRKQVVQKALKNARSLKEKAEEDLIKNAEKQRESMLERTELIKRASLTNLKEKVVSVVIQNSSNILKKSDALVDKKIYVNRALEELKEVLKDEHEKKVLIQSVKNN